MKKVLSIVLTLTLLITLTACLGGCKKEQKPLRVVVDLLNTLKVSDGYWQADFEKAVDSLKNDLSFRCRLTDVEFEILPREGGERKSKLTRLRTEIMAGQGPDVFIVGYANEYDSQADRTTATSLFLMPEKSMELGLFYPLDDYIENAQYMQWDKLNQTVMAAGRSEEYGQVLLPLAYEFPVTMFLKSQVEHESSPELTWDDMLADDSRILQAAAGTWGATWVTSPFGSEPFGRLADYKNKELLFTEEEMLQRLEELYSLNNMLVDDTFDDLPLFYKARTTRQFTDPTSQLDFTYHGKWDQLFYGDWLAEAAGEDEDAGTDVTMIPIYSDDGGFTATVSCFAAINANTKRPDDAFLVLDWLLSAECQSASALYLNYIEQSGLPVEDDVIETQHSRFGPWITEADAAELRALRESMTHVRFVGAIDLEMFAAYLDLKMILDGTETGDVQELIHTTYTRMKRELSE